MAPPIVVWKSWKNAAARALLNLIELPNGTVFDPNGAIEDAAVLPQKFKSTHMLRYSTPAAAVAEAENIMALVGTRATVTATKVTTGTITCIARVEQVMLKSRGKKGGLWNG